MFMVVLLCFYDGNGVCAFGRKHSKILGFVGLVGVGYCSVSGKMLWKCYNAYKITKVLLSQV